MSKIFELCLSEKLNYYLTTSDNQFGFKAKHSTDMWIYAVKSVVKYYNHFHSPVYTCFLDASKAFDRINGWTLFPRLIARGVPCPLVKIIMFWYRTQTICVKWGKLCSSYFSVSNGARQDGIISPKLFSVYVDGLSLTLSSTKTGCVINDKSVNHVFYADDLCIMSASLAGLQKLIDICYNYSVQTIVLYCIVLWGPILMAQLARYCIGIPRELSEIRTQPWLSEGSLTCDPYHHRGPIF